MGSESQAADPMPLEQDTALVAQGTPVEAGQHDPAEAGREPPPPRSEEANDISPSSRKSGRVAGTLAVIAALGWTAFFVWARRAELSSGISPSRGAEWIGNWSGPVLLVIALWLVSRRFSSREGTRFSDAAQALASESALVEQRLARLNRELGAARDALAHQARELDMLGRSAAETLSENAERLQHLTRTNSDDVQAISRESATALENMNQLRQDLPTIAEAARTASADIGQAGQEARTQVEELTLSLARVADAGQANEELIASLREAVGATLAEFGAQADRLGEISEQRFTALAEQGAIFRAELDTREEEAFAALQARAEAFGAHLADRREEFDTVESATTEAFAQRLATLGEGTARLGEQLNANEAAANERWAAAIAGFDQRMREAIEHVAELDRQAVENARQRLAALAEEAERIDAVSAERFATFEAARDERDGAAAEREAASLAALSSRLEEADGLIAARREQHLASLTELGRREEALAQRLADLASTMDGLVHRGRDTQDRLEDAAVKLAMKLSQSRGMIDDGREALNLLNKDSARLLELVQAIAQQGSEALPNALAAAHEQLATMGTEAGALRDLVATMGTQGTVLAAAMTSTRNDSAAALEQLAALDERLGAASARAEQLSQKAGGELTRAIATLEQASGEVLAKLQDDQAGAVRAAAERLGTQGAEALDQALRSQVESSLARLRETAAQAGSAGQEAAQELRERMAEVEALTSALEQRVRKAREQAADPAEQEFARRMALIAESLNSASIDLTRVFAGEISDPDWAAYLRGDRAIFTRRTLRLLDRKETRAVADLYLENGEFRSAVNRYVHDFEGMLRDMLATRDGHTLAVTLLSSDVGKLYVSLAQATERQRAD